MAPPHPQRCLGFLFALVVRGPVWALRRVLPQLPWPEWALICSLELDLPLLVKVATSPYACKTLLSQRT